MLKALNDLILRISLNWIDQSQKIQESEEYEEFMQIYPNLDKLFIEGLKNDSSELERTLKHIFRTLKVWFLLKEEKKFHKTLSFESILRIKKKIQVVTSENDLFIPLILVYHDIGRFFDRKNHPHKSYSLISKHDLLSPYNLNDKEKLLISKVIQYHLMLATIFTGESTFYSVYSLLNDEEFQAIRSDEHHLDLFIDLLEIFTYIDILGYSYALMYDHYLDYYEKINKILKFLLKSNDSEKLILKKSLEVSKEWLEWRLACGLRIFQFIGTKPHLTEEFYFSKLKNSFEKRDIKFIKNLEWAEIKQEYLKHSCKVQIKYGLGILMLLAFGGFFRIPMKEDQEISPKLLYFWLLLSNEIKTRSKGREQLIWNVFFSGLPHWSEWNRLLLEKLNVKNLKFIINNSVDKLDKKRMEINLDLNFGILSD